MDRNVRYIIKKTVVIEDFADGSLAFLCDRLSLVSLNATAKDALYNLDGQRSISDVAAIMARKYGHSFEQVLADVQELMAELEEKGIVGRCLGFEEQK